MLVVALFTKHRADSFDTPTLLAARIILLAMRCCCSHWLGDAGARSEALGAGFFLVRVEVAEKFPPRNTIKTTAARVIKLT